MPTEDGRFKGMSVPAEAWQRIFGQGELFERQPDFDSIVPPLLERHKRERELYDRLAEVDEAR